VTPLLVGAVEPAGYTYVRISLYVYYLCAIFESRHSPHRSNLVALGSHPAFAALGLKVRFQEMAQALQSLLPTHCRHA
jgi:hypothetical protein